MKKTLLLLFLIIIGLPLTLAGSTTSDTFYSRKYGEKWIRITSAVNPGIAMYATSGIGTQAVDAASDAELFCFVGSEKKGFRIFSKSIGPDKALQASSLADGSSPVWVPRRKASLWHLDTRYADEATAPGLGITTQDITTDGSRSSLNLWQGVAGEAKFWSNSKANGGSRWHISQVEPHPVTIALTQDNPYANNYQLGRLSISCGQGAPSTSIVSRKDVGTKTLYLPSGATPTLSVEYQYHGYTSKVEGSTVTFTYDGSKYQYLWYEHPDYQFYRIPAIVTTRKGELIAFSDYRYCHNDIGLGRVDQYMRMSSDNGITWSEPRMVAQGRDDTPEDAFYTGFGDPALCADRESDRILLMTVAGNNFCGWAETDYHKGKPASFARFYSEDGGRTWSGPENVTDQFYQLFGTGEDRLTKAFIGSGKIFQSRIIKVGRYYRLYAALCAWPNGNRVLFSDDFGDTWHVLGGITARPAPKGDEPKCEELPDGSVILSSRKYYGRYYNIFSYTSLPTAEGEASGTWGTCVASHDCPGGIAVGSNSTNGEIMIVQARKSNGEVHTLAIQSLPFDNGRSGVGLWWKDITDKSSYQSSSENSPKIFASNWTRGLRVENIGYSAYSTFTLQADGNIGFFYEESPGTYAMVYIPLSISEITGGAFQSIL